MQYYNTYHKTNFNTEIFCNFLSAAGLNVDFHESSNVLNNSYSTFKIY